MNPDFEKEICHHIAAAESFGAKTKRNSDQELIVSLSGDYDALTLETIAYHLHRVRRLEEYERLNQPAACPRNT